MPESESEMPYGIKYSHISYIGVPKMKNANFEILLILITILDIDIFVYNIYLYDYMSCTMIIIMPM